MTELFTYKGISVHIVAEIHKKKEVYWIIINRRPITFVSRIDTAKRIAISFIDLTVSDEFREGYNERRRGPNKPKLLV